MLTAMGENSLYMSSCWVKCSNVQTGLKNKGNCWVYRAATLRQNPSSSFWPKSAPMCILFARSIISKPIMGCVCTHCVVSPITKLTSAGPEAPSAQAGR